MGEFLKICGDYHNWNVYRKSVIICDVTEMFISRYLLDKIRTIDQMRQAARSCKQNIVEGVSDGTVSTKMGIHLIGVARGSVRELLEDYCDYLRQHKFQIWDKTDKRIIQVRNYCRTHYDPIEFVKKCEARSPETVANIMITIIYQMDAMLAKVLKAMEADFIENGGVSEAMSNARRRNRGF